MRTCFHHVFGLPEPEPKELQHGIRLSPDLRLLFVMFQEQFSLNIGFKTFTGTFRRSLASTEDHHVILVANEAVASSLELVIEFIEHDVGENGTVRPTLR